MSIAPKIAIAALAATALVAPAAGAAEKPVALLDGTPITKSEVEALDASLVARQGQLALAFTDRAAYRAHVRAIAGEQPARRARLKLKRSRGAKAKASFWGGHSVLHEFRNAPSVSWNITVNENSGINSFAGMQWCGWFWSHCTSVNDNVSHVDDRSRGGTELWEHANHAGASFFVHPGHRVNLDVYGFDNRASSVKVYR